MEKNEWFRASHFRKPPNINRYSTDINSIYASPMESRNPGAAWFVADLEVTKKSMRFPGRDSQICAKQLTSQCGQPRYGPKYLDLSPMTDPWCHIWCSMDPIKEKTSYVSIFLPAPWIRHGSRSTKIYLLVQRENVGSQGRCIQGMLKPLKSWVNIRKSKKTAKKLWANDASNLF